MSSSRFSPEATPDRVLEAWFGLPNKNEEDDALVRERLGPHFQRARQGEYDHWTETEKGRLALILLFDQVPRHLFRDQPEQYATDERARDLASDFYENGFPEAFDPSETFYAALPYLHTEDVDKQKQVNPIMHECADRIEELRFMGEVADNYLETIERFGRFPHRNEILNRETTDEEAEWLEEDEN